MIDLYKKLTKQPAILLLVAWFSFAWSWAFFTDTLELAGSQTQGLILTFFVVLVNVSLSVLIMWKLIKLVGRVQKKYLTPVFLAIAVFLFALADYLVAWLVALIWIGPQGTLDSVLPLGSMSLLIADSPLRYASRFVGFYGLAGFVWMTAYLIYNKKVRKYTLIPVSILAILSITGWALYKSPNGSSIDVTIVSEKLDDRVSQVDPSDTDLVVFPEYGLDKVNNDNLEERIKRTKEDQKITYLLGSDQENIPNVTGHKNNMRFGNTLNGFTANQHKYRLIPGGEDLPFMLRTLLRATNQKSTLDYFSSAKGVIKGPAQLQPFNMPDGTKVAAAVCSSIIAPQDYRDFTRSGATIFTNSASLTTFQGSPVFAWQQKNLARLMSTANSRYFLQSANAATAYALDNNGNQIIEISDVNTTTVRTINNTNTTPYTALGEWMVGLGSVALGYLAVRSKKGQQHLKNIKNRLIRK